MLAWSKANQDWYFQTSVMMAGVVATQNTGTQAECVNDWYFKDEETIQSRNEHIRSVLRDHPEYHPAGVILAVLEKACGSFNFASRP